MVKYFPFGDPLLFTGPHEIKGKRSKSTELKKQIRDQLGPAAVPARSSSKRSRESSTPSPSKSKKKKPRYKYDDGEDDWLVRDGETTSDGRTSNDDWSPDTDKDDKDDEDPEGAVSEVSISTSSSEEENVSPSKRKRLFKPSPQPEVLLLIAL